MTFDSKILRDDDLSGLAEAVSVKGIWSVMPFDGDHGWWIASKPSAEKSHHGIAPVAGSFATEADATFVAALVNAYRRGDLVLSPVASSGGSGGDVREAMVRVMDPEAFRLGQNHDLTLGRRLSAFSHADRLIAAGYGPAAPASPPHAVVEDVREALKNFDAWPSEGSVNAVLKASRDLVASPSPPAGLSGRGRTGASDEDAAEVHLEFDALPSVAGANGANTPTDADLDKLHDDLNRIYQQQKADGTIDRLRALFAAALAATPEPDPRQDRQNGTGAAGATPDLNELADRYVQDVMDLDDRTSPEDWPEALLLTGEELHRLLISFASEAAMPQTPPNLTSGEKAETGGGMGEVRLFSTQADQRRVASWVTATATGETLARVLSDAELLHILLGRLDGNSFAPELLDELRAEMRAALSTEMDNRRHDR